MHARVLISLAGALAATGCINISRRPDPLLGHIAQAEANECPANERDTRARGADEMERVGVTEYEFSRVVLSGGRGTMRTRRLDIEAGGVIPWHEHTQRQGTAIILAGEMTEYRNDCRVPIVHRVGDVVREETETAHYWRNEGMGAAVVLVTDVLP